MERIIGIIMILIGASLIITTNIIKYRVHEKQETMINEFQNTIGEVDKEDPVEKIIKGSENVSTSEKKDTIGIISIPKINLTAAIGEGVDQEMLKYAVGHFKNTPFPEQKGNFCLAGHRSYAYGEFFNRLDELEIGDQIIVTTNSGVYKYDVYEKKVVEPSDISVLDNSKSSIITLVTCTPIRIATHRLIVKGKLQE